MLNMKIMSHAFKNEREIPARYTCDGMNKSPPIGWTDVPDDTKSLTLIVDDPDAPDPSAPQMTWTNWLLYNIPASSAGLAEGIAPDNLPSGTLQGMNDWYRTSYGGPCPALGRHRYFFRLYALDVVLPDLRSPTREDLERAMQGHVLARSSMVGLYRRHVGYY
jgi:Raf kinase inhibitor-like YbhB/YbcL family protein